MACLLLDFGTMNSASPSAATSNPNVVQRLETEILVDFGDVPEPINELLQLGVMAYRADKSKGEDFFQQALSQAPESLPVYLCLYKIHTYNGRLDDALKAAQAGLVEAAKQAGLSLKFQEWKAEQMVFDGPGRFALYTLKALAFIRLRRNEREEAKDILCRLSTLDPSGLVGWSVIASLLDGCGELPNIASHDN